jgi:hypothetical protein
MSKLQLLPVNDIMVMAKNFAESGMFTDAKQAVQAFVKIQAGQEIGLPPFASMSGIHIIQGKPTLGAGVIASAVKGSGKYDYKVKQMNETICSIDFFQGSENIGNSTFTIEEAKKAGTKNIDKFPKNMLFARAISNGVKWFCPDVFSGPVYVPEEMPEQTIDTPHVEVVDEVSQDRKNEIAIALIDCTVLEELTELWSILNQKEKELFKKDFSNKRKTIEQNGTN